MIIFSNGVKENYNAGPKAPRDINSILRDNSKIIVCDNTPFDSSIKKLIDLLKKDFIMLKYWRSKELFLIQMPFSITPYFKKFVKKHNCILLIHDLVGLRNSDVKRDNIEMSIYREAKYIISHNKKMSDYLFSKGIEREKVYNLNLFDYICSSNRNNNKKNNNSKRKKVVYTGNLDKAPFIKEIDTTKINFDFNLYGVCENLKFSDGIFYKGKEKPENLPNIIEGDLGLVWDGGLDEKDEYNDLKNYTKYNNPHKLSCYIAAGLPVIVWEKSAICDFVREHNIGYSIKSIYDINNLDFADYEIKKSNVLKLSEKVRNGYYTKNVIKNICDDINKKK